MDSLQAAASQAARAIASMEKMQKVREAKTSKGAGKRGKRQSEPKGRAQDIAPGIVMPEGVEDAQGVPAYKGGARLLVSNMHTKTTKRVFVPVQIFAHGLQTKQVNEREGKARRGEQFLLVKAQEPMSRKKAEIKLRVADLNAVRFNLDDQPDKSGAQAVRELEVWLGMDGSKPSNDVLSKALSHAVCGLQSSKGFELYCDTNKLKRMQKDKARQEREKQSGGYAAHRSSPDEPRGIILNSTGRSKQLAQEDSSSSDSDGESAQYEADRRMKAANRKANQSGKPFDVTMAEIAVRETRKTLEQQRESILEHRTISRAHQSSQFATMQKMLKEQDQTRKQNREYKILINDALNAMDMSETLENKAKRDRVRHMRELNRMKWTLFPFRSGGKWQKGAVIGPGPTPIRALALMKREPAQRKGSKTKGTSAGAEGSARRVEQVPELVCASTTLRDVYVPPSSKPKPPATGSGYIDTQTERLRKAFQVLRELAKTNDEYYLDFKAAFARIDRKGRGYIGRKDLEFMLGGLMLTEADIDQFWGHFNRYGKDYIDADGLVWGFFNQRKLLEKTKQADETLAFRTNLLDRVAQQRAKTRSKQDVALRIQIMGVRNLVGIPLEGLDVFCIVSCCKIMDEDGEDVIVISDEERSRDARLRHVGSKAEASWGTRRGSMHFKRGTMCERRHERLLIECRANTVGSRTDVHSIFLGEIFYPVLDLDATTNKNGDEGHTLRWIDLKHGDAKGQILVRVELCSDAADVQAEAEFRAWRGSTNQHDEEDYDSLGETDSLIEEEEEEKLHSWSGSDSPTVHSGVEEDEDDDYEVSSFATERDTANRLLNQLLGKSGAPKYQAFEVEKSRAQSVIDDLLGGYF